MTKEQLKQGNVIIKKIDYLKDKHRLLSGVNKYCPMQLDSSTELGGDSNLTINLQVVEFEKQLIAFRIKELEKELEVI